MDKEQLKIMEEHGQDPPTVLKGLRKIPKAYYVRSIRGKDERVYLPSDGYSMPRYLRKGFKIDSDQTHHKVEERTGVILTYDPSLDTQEETTEEYKCEICGKECGNPTSLGTHKRSHKNKK